MTEFWKWIPGYEGLYKVSSLGRVKSVKRVDHSGHLRESKYLTACKINQTHFAVCLVKNRKRKFRYVSDLVLSTFIGPRPKDKQARHFPDRNTANNKLNNLSWATPKRNQRDRIVHGTANRGEKVHTCKTSLVQVKQIKKLWERGTRTRKQISRKTGVPYGIVKSIILGDSWRYV